jgi:hypothetical protein
MGAPQKVELYPTRLNMPRWFGEPEVRILPGLPEHYQIEQVLSDWFIVMVYGWSVALLRWTMDVTGASAW